MHHFGLDRSLIIWLSARYVLQSRVTSVIRIKRRDAGRRFVIIVTKLRYWQHFDPFCLSIVQIASEILFKCLIRSFRLSIGLWMERCGQLVLSTNQIHERGPKLGREPFVSVGNDLSGRSVVRKDCFEEFVR